MEKELKYWLTFYSPGSFTANTWTRECGASVDISEIDWPNNAYAVTINRREDVIDGEEAYTGQPEQMGLMIYHPDSKVESLEEVKKNPAASSTLIQNMECNKWDHVVWSRWGDWPQPFDPAKAKILKRTQQSVESDTCQCRRSMSMRGLTGKPCALCKKIIRTT